MKIYFSGSISGGREYLDYYIKIGEILKNFGHEILTEHILDPLLSAQGEENNPISIFNRDIEMLKESDIIIAEISTPSHGVGYEIAIGVEIGKPIMCLLNENLKNHRISAMIEGNAPDKLIIKRYNDNNLKEIIEDYFYTMLKLPS